MLLGIYITKGGQLGLCSKVVEFLIFYRCTWSTNRGG